MSKKILSLFFLISLTVLGGLGFSSKAQASDSCSPTIKIQETRKNSVKMKVTCSNLVKTKVAMKILVTNEDTDSDSYKKVKTTLGKKGSVSLMIKGLDSATKYSFKVKLKESSAKSYASYSSDVSTTTEGSDYDSEIEKINGITEDSVKLHVSCDDLKKKSVNVQVAYKKKSSWSTKTFNLTLDSDGEGAFTLDGLKSDTQYNFKIRIKKDGDDSYSVYSSAKTATTDED